MEFKGTKTDWEIIKDKPVLIKVGNIIYRPEMTLDDFDSWEDYHDVTEIESIYNALLISKAPKLLDFINRISGEMLRNDFVLDEKWYEQAQQLIKQATEL